MKKIISIILLILSFTIILSSCGFLSFNTVDSSEESKETTNIQKEYQDPETYNSDYETVINKYLKDLSGNEYEGSVKIIITGKNMITGDDNTSAVISKDWKERNEAVENNLGVSIATTVVTPENLMTELRASTLSGTYYADAILYPQQQIGSLMQSGVILNLLSLPGFDYDVDYLYKSAVSAGTGGGQIYAVSGPASLNPDNLKCIFYNKSIVSTITEDDLSSVVLEGNWTVDYYKKLTSALSPSQFSYATQNSSQMLPDLFFFGLAGKLTNSNLGSYPTINLNGEAVKNRVNVTKQLINDGKHYTSSLDAINAFNSGSVLFLIDSVSTMKTLANSNVDWGILPMPKENADQKNYFSLADYTNTQFFSVPKTATNYQESADLISALNIISYGYSSDVFVQNASYYYLRDQGSIDSLAKVIENPVFDFAYSFSSSNADAIANATFFAVRNTVSDVSPLDRYLEMYTSYFNDSMYYLFDLD